MLAQIADLPRQLSEDGVVLDGTLLVLDDDGRPEPALLRSRLDGQGLPGRAAYVAGDLLWAGGEPVTRRSFRIRRRWLEAILEPGDRATVGRGYEADGTLVADSQGPRELGTDFDTAGRPEIGSALAGTPNSQIRDSADLGHDIIATAVPIQEEGQVVGAVRITKNVQQVNDNVRNVYRSKAVGEPPLMLAIAVWAAAKNALSYASPGVESALQLPATGEEMLRCLTLAAGDVALSHKAPITVE